MAGKQQRLTGARIKLPRHLYVGDGIPDHQGNDRCRDCGLGKDAVVHQLEADPQAVEIDRRITGERDDYAVSDGEG